MEKTYTRHVGEKFHEDGSARAFPGNTIICPVDPDSSTMKTLNALHEAVLAQAWHTNYAILPPSSYHMTVFDLVCDQVRKTENWTSRMALDAPLETVDALMIEEWKKTPPAPMPKMQFDRLDIGDYITVRLAPKDEESNRIIRGYRDQLSEITGVRHPYHKDYGFHISIAYALTSRSAEETQQIEAFKKDWESRLGEALTAIDLLPPELTFFVDMTNFAASRETAQHNVTK